MSQSPSKLSLLRDLPRRPMTPEQQLEALRKVQSQAEQRVKLGMQLFKAAESRINAQQDVLEKIHQEQDALREEVQQDVAKSLQDYDQWIARIDESFTAALQSLESRIDQISDRLDQMSGRIHEAVARAEQLYDQTRQIADTPKPSGQVPTSSHAQLPATAGTPLPAPTPLPGQTPSNPADDIDFKDLLGLTKAAGALGQQRPAVPDLPPHIKRQPPKPRSEQNQPTPIMPEPVEPTLLENVEVPEPLPAADLTNPKPIGPAEFPGIASNNLNQPVAPNSQNQPESPSEGSVKPSSDIEQEKVYSRLLNELRSQFQPNPSSSPKATEDAQTSIDPDQKPDQQPPRSEAA